MLSQNSFFSLEWNAAIRLGASRGALSSFLVRNARQRETILQGAFSFANSIFHVPCSFSSACIFQSEGLPWTWRSMHAGIRTTVYAARTQAEGRGLAVRMSSTGSVEEYKTLFSLKSATVTPLVTHATS